MSLLGKIGMYWRFARDVRKFLKEPLTLEESHRIISQRLKDRERNLLTMVKRAIYENEASPYHQLLKLAGCEYGDFERMVRSGGIESALRKLYEEGVYISIEEFKGKQEIVRGGKTFQFKESDFDNRFITDHLESRSGASRSAGTRTVYSLDHLTSRAVYRISILDAYDALGLAVAQWAPIIPGHGIISLLSYTKAGQTPVKWFSQIDKKGFKPSLKNRMETNYLVYMARASGVKWPGPEYVALDDAGIVAQWMADTIKELGGCYMATYVSAAVRICQAAKKEGLDITGAKFYVAGEPLTEVKRKEIESAGASVCPSYVFTEGGWVGLGCFNPVAADDVHLLKDSLALIQHQREVSYAGVSVDAFLFTSLLPSAPKVLLNVESGDWGVIETRSCGCKLEELGFTDHIHNIRSFDKLTGEGMTVVGTDLVRIIEEVLPAKFGGASTDYQMVEEEDEQGHTKMSLLVSPEVGEIDEAELTQTLLAELGKGKDLQRMMAYFWSQAGTLRVKRMRPVTTARGKLLPLHILGHK